MWLHVVLAALSLHAPMAAEGPVDAVQDALKRQQFYSGEPSGVFDKNTREALRRFQLHHGLPATGEIDTATLQRLQENDVAARHAQKPPAASERIGALAEKDRKFLKKVETGVEPTVPDDTAFPPPVSRPAEANAPFPAEARKPVLEKNRGVEKPRQSASRKTERRPVARKTASREVEAAAKAPTRVVPSTQFDTDADPLGSHGVRVIRSRPTGSGGNEAITVYKRTTTTIAGTPVPDSRRTKPAEPRKRGFFDRLFNDDD